MKCPFFNEVVTGDFNDMCIRYAGLRDFNQETINHFIFSRPIKCNQDKKVDVLFTLTLG